MVVLLLLLQLKETLRTKEDELKTKNERVVSLNGLLDAKSQELKHKEEKIDLLSASLEKEQVREVFDSVTAIRS